MKRSLFIMLSGTATGIGRTIRRFSGCNYNHVSLSLDPTFRSWVSFARYVRDVPLAGGFVRESAERFFAMEGPIPVKIHRIYVDEARWQQLDALFSTAGNTRLIYNSFQILATVFGRHWTVTGAYTCLDFASAVLGRDYGSLSALETDLECGLIYEGDYKELLTDDGSRTDAYFTQRGFRQGTADTARHFGRLVYRSLHPGRYKDPLLQLNPQ